VKRWLLLLALVAPAAFGQCLPSSVFPSEAGTDYIVVKTPFVEGRVGWCLESRTAAGDRWVQIVYQWCLTRNCSTLVNPFAVLDQLKAASAPKAAASAVSAQYSIKLTDPTDILRYKQWRYDACVALTLARLTTTALDPLPAGYCGTRLPDPVADRWVTINGSIFTAAGGRLTGLVSGKKAAAGLTCNCDTISATSGARRFCAAPPATTAATEVAECQKATP